MAYRIEVTETAEKEIAKKLELYLIERLDKRIKKLSSVEILLIMGCPLR